MGEGQTWTHLWTARAPFIEDAKVESRSQQFCQRRHWISDGFHFDGSVTVQPTLHDAALYKAVVKNMWVALLLKSAKPRESMQCASGGLLRLNMSASDPGCAAVHEKELSDIFKYGLKLLDAVFGLKSPNTLFKRLCAIKLYNQWQMRNYTETWIPLSEQRVWAYMRALKEEKAPVSRAVNLLESIRFCHYMLKVDGALEVLESLRIKGLAAQLHANKKTWHPSDVLTVNEVEFLHHCLKDQNMCEVDRIFTGHLLQTREAPTASPKSMPISGTKNEPSGHSKVLLREQQKDQQM